MISADAVLVPILPEVILLIAALLVLAVDTFLGDKRWLTWVGLLGVLAAGVAAYWLAQQPPMDVQGMAVSDAYTTFFRLVILSVTALALLIAMNWLDAHGEKQGEFNGLLLLAAIGMSLMAAATHLLMVFVALELLSLSLYILAGFEQERATSGEAALKYLLLGAFSSAIFLYGMALMYAATGALDFAGIAQHASLSPLFLVAVGLLIVGFGFKVAAVPFHMWTPDVYQGAPTPITAFMSVGAKAAGFAAFLRVFVGTLGVERAVWVPVIAGLALLTMTLGNLAALRQVSLKRMLAYSSIAHAGYMLVGLSAANSTGTAAVLFYLLAYTFMNIGAFAVIIALEKQGEGDVTLSQIRGLARTHPLLAAAMAIFMFSLTGIPPFAGFFGKLYLFQAAVQANLTWLAIAGMLNSAVSAYYYLNVLVQMYMTREEEPPVLRWRPVLALATGIGVLFVLGIGLYPDVWMHLAKLGMKALLG
ncbi:MAG: NADH-quinone oxidoreductase subunit N [Chloroflexi bacterium]|nr:NADH-quinone oxidoreductase subunit N [Chloroflexota bacterium]